MADVYADLKNWSATAASNLPSGSSTIGTGLDDNLRQIQATVVQDLSSVGADIASATTTDIGAVAGLFHTITGTTTITGFGTVRAGIWKVLTFSGALTITYNATSMITPDSVDLTIAAKDSLIAESLGSGNWKVHAFKKAQTSINGVAAPKTPTITATLDSSAMTVDMTAQYLDFRSATLTSGTITTLSCDPTALVVPATATLGTTSGVASRIAVAVVNDGGTAELAVANTLGLTIDESALITTTTIGTGSDSTATWYSTTGTASKAFRIVGYIDSTQATAGVWATALTQIQGGAADYVISTLTTTNVLSTSNVQTIAHGRGVTPKNITYSLLVETTTGGWAVGDEIYRWVDGLTSSADTTICIGADATNIIVACGTSANISILNKTTGAHTASAVGNFKVRVRIS